jgi:O-antigen ligase
MTARSDSRATALLVAFGALSILTGLIISLLDPRWALAGIAGAAAVGLVLYDYRVGVILLTILLPWSSSPLLPKTHGFDLINFLILASVVSLALRRIFGKEPMVRLPRVVQWCYLLPIAVGVFVAWPHLPEGARNFPSILPGYPSAFDPIEFLKSRVIKPLYFVIYAFLLANAVRDSKKPEGLILAFGLSSILGAFAVMVDFASGGGDVADRNTHLQGLGVHANGLGTLLALAAGPLLFLCVGAGSKAVRVASGGAFAIVSVGLLLTGSRGATVIYVIVVAAWLLRRHRFTDLLVAATLAGMLSLAVPDKVWDRLTLGLDEAGASSVNTSKDELTKGRVALWGLLAPEISDSPVWGRGVGSTAWNSAVTAGKTQIGHPHNLYLAILLDVGILGFAAIMYLYYRYAQAFRRLSTTPMVSPVVQDFFSGAFASFVGMLVMGMANGSWTPHLEQTYLWFALGFSFAYWKFAGVAQAGPRATSNERARPSHAAGIRQRVR